MKKIAIILVGTALADQGRLKGGFVILPKHVPVIAGVSEPANNCNGGYCEPSNNCGSGQNCGNCVTGCGQK